MERQLALSIRQIERITRTTIVTVSVREPEHSGADTEHFPKCSLWGENRAIWVG
jgi:hypothetical protein